jgi:hypothetical protein
LLIASRRNARILCELRQKTSILWLSEQVYLQWRYSRREIDKTRIVVAGVGVCTGLHIGHGYKNVPELAVWWQASRGITDPDDDRPCAATAAEAAIHATASMATTANKSRYNQQSDAELQ